MNKSVIFSLLSIFAVIGLVGGVSFALFSSTASNTGNTFGAGTLKLAINGSLDSLSTPKFTVTAAKPGDVTATQVLKLSNTGTVNALTTTLVGINVTPTPASPNLGDKLNLELWKDVNNDGVIDSGDLQIGITKSLIDAQWTGLGLTIPLSAGASQKVLARITFDSSADNTYQGSSVSFNFNFRADQ